jgi:prefoldin subunit 5
MRRNGRINEMVKTLHCFFIVVIIAFICAGAGCKTQQPVIVDTGDIERLRAEYQQIRGEYERLQQDYQRLAENQQFYVDYYRNATERIGSGLDQLSELSADSAGEIQRLRGYATVLRNIINGIIAGEQGEGQ